MAEMYRAAFKTNWNYIFSLYVILRYVKLYSLYVDFLWNNVFKYWEAINTNFFWISIRSSYLFVTTQYNHALNIFLTYDVQNICIQQKRKHLLELTYIYKQVLEMMAPNLHFSTLHNCDKSAP
jgi:hypothetical protein